MFFHEGFPYLAVASWSHILLCNKGIPDHQNVIHSCLKTNSVPPDQRNTPLGNFVGKFGQTICIDLLIVGT